MTSAATGVRRAARAVLFDDLGRLVTIRRSKPGQDPYWTMPGGGEEEGDADLVATVVRELYEELGATAVIGDVVYEIRTPESAQYFFRARLVTLDESARSGPEFADPARGSYDVDRIPLDRLAQYDLKPAVVRDHIVANALELMAGLPARQ